MGTRSIHNPDFPLSLATLPPLEARLRANPVALERPVIVLGGWRSPRFSPRSVESVLRPLTSGRAEDFLTIAYPLAGSVEAAAGRALKAIRARFADRHEFDIVGISMGGLVARLLLHGLVRDAGPGSTPIRAKRLFTLATPHAGAVLADYIRPDRAASSMRRGSALLSRLASLSPEGQYEFVPYAQLRDWWVGATRTAPPDWETQPRWLDAETRFAKVLSHFAINHDPRILADIALKLRGEEPVSRKGTRPPRD